MPKLGHTTLLKMTRLMKQGRIDHIMHAVTLCNKCIEFKEGRKRREGRMVREGREVDKGGKGGKNY